MNEEKPDEHKPEDELPRRSFFEALPKRSLSRILILIAALVGIVYLQRRASAIASCMSDAFRAPPATKPAGAPGSVRMQAPARSMDGHAR